MNSAIKSRQSDWLDVLSGGVLSVVVFVMYFPALAIGFFSEDHVVLDEVIRMPLLDFVAYAFQVCVSPGFCRPAQIMGIWSAYQIWGNQPFAFRVLQILIHLANCLLLYWLTHRVSKKSTVALVAAIVYAGLPIVVTNFPWLGAADSSVTFFYLAAIALWLEYLRHDKKWAYWLAIISAVLALLNKEIGVTIPFALFLADRWLDARPIQWQKLVHRYLPFALVWSVYAWATLQRLAAFMGAQRPDQYAGIGIGPHIFSNLLIYLAALASMWPVPSPIDFMILGAVALVVGYQIIIRRNLQITFLSSVALLTLAPVLLFAFVGTRYLYLPVMASAILFARLVDRLFIARDSKIAISAGALFISGIVLFNALNASDGLTALAAFTRQFRTPIRPIFQQHAAFSPGTQLYFIDSPISPRILSGMLALRYGREVGVSTTTTAIPAELRSHNPTYVYYFDEQSHAVEQLVETPVRMQITPALPFDFAAPLQLEGFEVVHSNVKRGESIIVLLYWRALAPIDRDYSVFAHLVDEQGQTIAGADGPPLGGKLPTSAWRPGNRVVDWLIVPITDDVPSGGAYRLEIGWYYLPTLEPVGGAEGALGTISIFPFAIK